MVYLLCSQVHGYPPLLIFNASVLHIRFHMHPANLSGALQHSDSTESASVSYRMGTPCINRKTVHHVPARRYVSYICPIPSTPGQHHRLLYSPDIPRTIFSYTRRNILRRRLLLKSQLSSSNFPLVISLRHLKMLSENLLYSFHIDLL